MSRSSLSLLHMVTGHVDEALRLMDGLPSEQPIFAYSKALALTAAGRKPEAVALLEPIEPAAGFDAGLHYALLVKFALSGRLDRFPEALVPPFVRLAEIDACTATVFAMCYATAGATEAALDWLEKAVPRGFFNYPYLRNHDRLMTSLHGHPRFERLMREIQLRWEAFRA